MTTLEFADTHNLVAFFSKPVECEGFEQIVDFLNLHTIKYALTINPTIYTLCIKQFWATVKAKIVNGEVQLQALVDGKKVIITESTIRRDLQLEDAEGVDCLPNAAIFEQLTLMGYEKLSQKLTFYKEFFSPYWKFLILTILQCLSAKTTVWNEFSSTMASAIICLATNQKFNFSKYIFESMVKNLDSVGNFLMYPRKPSRKNTEVPLPSGSLDIVADEVVYKKADDIWKGSLVLSSLEQSKTVNVSKHSNDSLLARGKTLRSDEDSLKLKELMELCTNLQQRVLDLEKTKTTQQNKIASLKRKVKKLEQKKRSRTHGLKRLHKVGMSRRVVSSGDEEDFGEDASKQGRRINDIDADEDITLVNVQDDTDNEMFDMDALNGEEVFVARQNENVIEKVVDGAQVSTAATTSQAFNDEEEYVSVKEDEYNNLTITSEEACRAYQEIVQMMDEGWMVTRTEYQDRNAHIFPMLYTGPRERNIDEYWWRIYKSGDLKVLES
ncbi:hypothetical protein Tco_0475547 [Tanacetum coccineum]